MRSRYKASRAVLVVGLALVTALVIAACTPGGEVDLTPVQNDIETTSEQVQNNINSSTSQIRGDISDLADIVASIGGDSTRTIVDLQQQVSSLNSENSQLEGRISTLQTELQEARDQASQGGGGVEVISTLDTVLERGELICGVKIDSPGYGFQNPDGSFDGNDIEFCRAVAAAIFGDSTKVRFREATGGNRFELLGSGQIDVLIRTTTWTASRDTNLNVAFTATTYYDGQGFMIKEAFANSGNISSVNDLGGARVCVLRGTTTEEGLQKYFTANNIDYTPSFFTTDGEALAAYQSDQCDVLTSDKSQLAGWAFATEQETSVSSIILPETITKEPLGPSTRDNDSVFYDVVQWTVYGMIIAEEEGVTSQNVAQWASNPDANNVVQNLLGTSGEGIEIGKGKISSTFMRDVLEQVGNYGEVYDKTLGSIGIKREGTFNALACPGGIDECTPTGGLIWAPPLR